MFTYPRIDNWTGKWSEFVKDTLDLQRDLILDWGDINCTQFSADGIEAITDHNPYDEGEWRGKFSSSLSAVKVIKRRGFNTLDDVIASLFPEIPLSFVWPGDVVLVKSVPWSDETDAADGTLFAREVMPHGVALADPPYYYAVTEQGVGKGDLYKEAVRGFAVGHTI
jgi:hypothetical protein